MAWATVGSVWIHLAMAALFLVRCGSPGVAEPRRERSLSLVARVQAPATRRAAVEEVPEEGTARKPDPEGELDPAARVGAVELAELTDVELLAALEAVDPASLGDLDAATLRALLARGIPERLLRRWRLPTPETRATASSARPESGASATATGDRAAKVAAPETGDRPPDTSALDVSETPTESELRPESAEPPEEVPPEERWIQYVAASERSAPEKPVSDTRFISERDTRADVATRAAVIAPTDGPNSRSFLGSQAQAGVPLLVAVDGTPDGTSGDAPAAGLPSARPQPKKAGRGALGAESGAGAPDSGGGRRGGELAAGGRTSPDLAGAIVIAGGASPRQGPADAPRGDRAAPRRDTWAPQVARIVLPSPTTAPAPLAIVAPDPAPGDNRARRPRPDQFRDRGGSQQAPESDEDTAKTAAQSEIPEEGDDAETEVSDTQVESIADLRADLGWGGFDRSPEPPRRVVTGNRASDGSMSTSSQTASELLAVAQLASTDAVDAPLGRYRAQLDEEIKRSWLAMDLSVHERALGIQGDVVVRFVVQADGKVVDKLLVRSSGNNSLDRMAMDAVADRLPKIPRNVEMNQVLHEYRFRYRNPTIVGTP